MNKVQAIVVFFKGGVRLITLEMWIVSGDFNQTLENNLIVYNGLIR